MNAGLYGAGSFAAFLAFALARGDALRISAVASRTPQRAFAFAAKHQIVRGCEDLDALLALDDLDAIIIATPPFDHAASAIRCLEAGKHVFTEKPLATTSEDASRIVKAADRAHRVIGIDSPMPFTDIVRAIGEIAGSRVAGALRRISVENIASCEGLVDDHWFWDVRASGGIFVEHGVHFFDWCGALLGTSQDVVAWTASTGRRQDRVFAAVGHERGGLATYYHAFIATADAERTRVIASFDGCDAVAVGWVPTRLRLLGERAQDAAVVVRTLRDANLRELDSDEGPVFDAGAKLHAYAASMRAAAADFCDAALRSETPRIVGAPRALLGLRVACAARAAAESGRRQPV